MCSSVDYWRCRWIKLGGALEYPQRGPSDPHLEPDLSTVCPQGYPQGWRADPQGWRGGTRRCGGARASPRRRRGRRRAGPTGRSASRSPCGRAGPAPPLRLRLTAALPRHRSPRAVPSARSPWRAARYGTRSPRAALPGRSRGGRSEAGGSRRDDAPASAPSGRPSRPGCSDGGHRRSAIADQDRVGVGGPPGSTRMRGGGCAGSAADSSAEASRLSAGAGGSVDAAARGAVATPVPFAPSVSARARAVRWRSDPATQKGGRRISFTPRPALLPSRSGAMTPFPGRAGAAAHPKDTRRPPFSAPPTPRAATAGPPEASTAPGPSSTPARTTTAGVANGSPRGNHRTAPDPARISRIRADAESAAPARGVAGAAWPASASRRSAALGPGASRPDPGPRSIPIRSGRSARTSHNPRERLPGVRSRGLPGDLAGQATISRRAGRAVRLPRGSSPTARTRGAAGSVPPDLVREADAEDGVGEVIPIRCPPSSVRPARTSAPTPGRGPARARRRDSGDQVAGLGAPRTRTGTATGPGPDSAPDPRHHGRTGEPPAADSGPARTRLAGPEARLGRGWFA